MVHAEYKFYLEYVQDFFFFLNKIKVKQKRETRSVIFVKNVQTCVESGKIFTHTQRHAFKRAVINKGLVATRKHYLKSLRKY